ncbi:MAG TPA: acetylxylan esterase, partial [Opitutaceae bacterium]|nr:acetylxylan esterase [Opitutaceae bacterium]
MNRLLISLAAAFAAATATLGDEPGSAFPIKPVPPHADFRVAVARIIVAPDRTDWTYKPGEPVTFRVAVLADNTPIEGAVVDYAIGPDLMPGEWKTVAVPTGGLELDGGSMEEPGFLRCKVKATIGGKLYTSAATAAFAPEKIVPFATDPED